MFFQSILLQLMQPYKRGKTCISMVEFNSSKSQAFFTWEAWWEKIMILGKVKRRGKQLPNRCYLCVMEEETVEHLLIHFSKTQILWNLILALFGICWVLGDSVKDTLVAWRRRDMEKWKKNIWGPALFCMFCAL